MKVFKSFFVYLMIPGCICSSLSCRGAFNPSQETVYVGSTPGDDYIKSLVGIKPGQLVDFMRWKITLGKLEPGENKFAISINYGESQPNTTGFKSGGKNFSAEGQYSVSTNNSTGIKGEIYHLKSPGLQGEIRMIKLNGNLFHLANSNNELLTGNGGWSYTLNRDKPIDDRTIPSFSNKHTSPTDTAAQVIYVGRTPCQEIANDHEMNKSSACFKLKWKLTLSRDPVSLMPATYSIRKVVDNRLQEITGKWTILSDAYNQAGVVIYQLDPGIPGKTISLLASDENVIFFLNKNLQLYTGNDNFSYTLNKSNH